ncbi:MAG TPA: divalent-cation tolerance protein CutA [Silvibacterium sp.]|jgi:periplasmic divalent cation tolerance protein|nr:divalent-cation tolerance protein CutA [Silvibacterium sp.]
MTQNSTPSACIVLSTAGSPEEAARISRALVERRLAACVSCLPGLASTYRWQGAIEEAREVLLIIKTSTERLTGLEAVLRELHSYEVPELLVLPVAAGSQPYLDWLLAAVSH